MVVGIMGSAIKLCPYVHMWTQQYAKSSTETVSRQEKLLDKLRRDNEYLKTEYRGSIRKPRAASSQSRLIVLQDQGTYVGVKSHTDYIFTMINLPCFRTVWHTIQYRRCHLSLLTCSVDSFAGKIQQEKKTNEELDKQISMVKQKIRKTRRRMGGVNAAQENQRMIEKQIRILENRLEKVLPLDRNAFPCPLPFPYSPCPRMTCAGTCEIQWSLGA